MIFDQPGLIAAFSRRPENMSLAFGDTGLSLNNRREFLKNLGIDYRRLVCCRQPHGARVHHARSGDAGRGAYEYKDGIADTDGLVTAQRNLPLAVFTADCLSIFLYDEDLPAIGLAHAGWRGSAARIAQELVAAMQREFGSQSSLLKAAFGPAIGECCYEVDREFKEVFGYSVCARDNRYYLSLRAVNKRQLLEAGLKEDNIIDYGGCTCCRQDEFFSYRREGTSCGRMISVMMLK